MLFTQRIDQSTCRILYIKWNLVVRGSWFVVGGWWLVVRGSWFVVRGRRFLCTYSTNLLFEILSDDFAHHACSHAHALSPALQRIDF